jgi:Transposase IS116/IS110/IS902 family
VLAEIGDLSRFQNPRQLMGYLGLVPLEDSTADRVKRGGITKAGNGRARRILVEAAWSYRYPPRVSRDKLPKVEAAPRHVREIAWKAQTRLCGRFQSLERKGKRRTVIVTAIAASYPPSFGRSIASSWHIDRRNVVGLWTARVVRCARPAHSPTRLQPESRGTVTDIDRPEVKVGPRQGNS